MLETFLVLIVGALERLELTRREQLSLLAALSCDLRTPLTVLFGLAEMFDA